MKIQHFILVLLIVAGCNSPRKKPEKHFLDGLTLISTETADSISNSNFLSAANVPFYTEDGELISPLQRIEVVTSGAYNTKIYADSSGTIKLWTVRRMTENELKNRENPLESGTDSSRLNQAALPFSVVDIKGIAHKLEDMKDSVVVLNFWFLGCKPCLQEIPELNKLAAKYRSKKVSFLAFALDPKEKLEKYLATHSFEYQIIPQSQPISDLYRIMGYPTHFVIDRKSIVRYHYMGSLDDVISSALDKAIEGALKANKLN